MPQYRYVAVEASSETVEGRMEAPSKAAVVERLHASGHVPIRISEAGLSSLANMDVAELFGPRRMSSRTLALITSQLSTLLQAGLALDEALAILGDLAEKPREKECLRLLLERISGGATLADAMAAQQNVFPDFYVTMIRAGETGSSLATVLSRLAEYLERSVAAREHIKSALLYPAIVAAVCCASIALLLGFVVPRFRPLFEQAGAALPLSARVLLAAADFFAAYWWAILLALLLIAIVTHRQLKNPAVRQAWQRLQLKAPFLGALLGKLEVVHFSRTLGTLLKNGVSLLNALAITRETTRNHVFSEAVGAVMERVKSGKGLAEPLRQTGIFPPLAVHLLRVAEESGRQDEMLFKIADIFEAETRGSVERMLALLGPALTIVMGAIVAGVIGSILTAVLSVYDLAM